MTRPPIAPTRPPLPVTAAAVVVGLVALVGSGGLLYFGIVASADNPDAGTPARIGFALVGVALQVAALTQLPGLWRGRPRAWHVLTCYLTASAYFSLYKILVEDESDSVVFLVVTGVVAVLLALPVSRRHARVGGAA